eukprot:7055533-Ditylum_brightwellii.AAC.1
MAAPTKGRGQVGLHDVGLNSACSNLFKLGIGIKKELGACGKDWNMTEKRQVLCWTACNLTERARML